jgi:uncharacterized cofD-like protein
MEFFRRIYKWLIPGMKIKRWIFLSWIGLTIFSIGLILFIRTEPYIAVEVAIAQFAGKILEKILGHPFSVTTEWVDLFFVVIGAALFIVGLRQWFVSIYKVVVPYENKSLVDLIYEKRHLGQGMKIVAIGGGTGLSSLLRGLKFFTSNLTAVVAVSDDGGSSGRLRKEIGVLPPGDIRNCLVALADEENFMGELFQYRFSNGNSLEGHSFGNLFLTAMTSIAGDFDQAIKQSGKILAIRGRVLPATLSPITLSAVMENGEIVEGESAITLDERRIDRVVLKPENCSPPKEVISSIADADLIVLGPGSLFTSVLPNLLVRGIVDAVNNSRGIVLYVCNVMTQPGETDEYKASDHLKSLLKSAPNLQIDYCLVNDEIPPAHLLEKYKSEGQIPVEPDLAEIENMGVKPITASLISATDFVRHDPARLSERIIRLVSEISHQPVAV